MHTMIDPLVSAVENLEHTLAEQPSAHRSRWAARFDQSLADVKRVAQQRNRALNTSNGKLVEIESPLLPSPTMDRLADGLHAELNGILEEVAALRSDVQDEGASFAPKLGAIHCRVVRLLESLKHYEHEETAAIQETVNTDIGGEN